MELSQKNSLEYSCSKCNGTGNLKQGTCGYCHGDGKVDWIDNIIPDINLLHDFENFLKEQLSVFEFEINDKTTRKMMASSISSYLDTLVSNRIIYRHHCDEFLNITIENFNLEFIEFKVDIK